MSLQDLYRTAVIEHNKNPRNFLELDDPSHQSRGLNALCGDDIRVYLLVDDGRIRHASFLGQASAITMASASMMTVRIERLTVSEALQTCDQLDRLLQGEPDGDLREQLGDLCALEGVRQYPSRIKAARLPWQAMKAALNEQAIASTE
ncbi:MAG: Fe-S cluster assembly sulfur transfer protein SufU [Pseudomonadota bacterium]